MKAKKSRKADLESKRFNFFLIGLALGLLATIGVLEYRTAFIPPAIPDEPPIEISTIDIPITARDVEEAPEKTEYNKKTDPAPDPEPEPKLKISDITGEEPEETGEPLANIGTDDDELDNEIETVSPLMLQRIARPRACDKFDEPEKQLECLNDWIARYVSEHVKYPELAKKMNLEDKVFVTFIIDEYGRVGKVKVERPNYNVLDEEARRVIEALPEFIPGSQNGRQVRMQMTVPINFRQF